MMETLSIACVTWNVKVGWPEQELYTLLGVKTSSKGATDPLPDLYFVNLQEVKSQPQNVVMDSLFEEPWTRALRDVLGPQGYVRIEGERLQGLVTSVFVKRQHLSHMRDIHTAVTRTGFGGLWGNKGAAAVRFSLYGCSICLVNCHLAAHDGGYKERVQDYNTIIDTMVFPIPETSNILFHDYVFWLGDLNFRIDGDLTAEVIYKCISSADVDNLIKLDELRKAQKTGDAFSQLSEGALTFPPTYRYHIGTSNYDLARRPAWTDRILHQVIVDAYKDKIPDKKLGIDQISYTPLDVYTQSDHKPLTATYKIKVISSQDRCVHFGQMETWTVGDGARVKYTLDRDVETSPWDYIALYKENFTAVHQYITYYYAPPTPSRGAPKEERTFELLFNDDLVQEVGSYVFLYHSGKYNCHLGLSESFQVIARET